MGRSGVRKDWGHFSGLLWGWRRVGLLIVCLLSCAWKDSPPRSKSDGVIMELHDVTQRREPVVVWCPKKEGTEGRAESFGLKWLPELRSWRASFRPSFNHELKDHLSLPSLASHSPPWPEPSFQIFSPWFSEVCVMMGGVMKGIATAVWAQNCCFWTVVFKKALESPLDCKEIQPVHPKDQAWVFIGRTDVEAEIPILWPHDAKSWLIGKDPDAGKDWGQEEKGTTEDEVVGWHHWPNGHGYGWTLGFGDGQGGLACCGSWGCKELDTTEQLNWIGSPGSSVWWHLLLGYF